MKNTQRCPKCQSSDVIRIPCRFWCHGARPRVWLGSTAFSAVKVTRYLCGDCGFIESWVEDPDEVASIRETYG